VLAFFLLVFLVQVLDSLVLMPLLLVFTLAAEVELVKMAQ
jgi:hypothetical protein